MRPTPLIAVIPVRDGVLPLGAEETVAEAGGRALLVGEGTEVAAAGLTGPGEAHCAEAGEFAPGKWAAALAPVLAGCGVVLLPASPDGRDLAPRLAHALGRRLLAGAVSVSAVRVVLARHESLVGEVHDLAGPVVATLLPGVRGVEAGEGKPEVIRIDLVPPTSGQEAEVLEVTPPDPASMDLSEAPRVISGGAGLGTAERFKLLARVAAALGATPGATRVVADAGWVPAHGYIGTTGATISPDLYVALGISGAVQHVTGIGHPDHIVAVNTDPSAPMMGMADLAIVTDARALLDELATRLGLEGEPT
jgi:electron transfer flavoprotein alpha subunit